MSTIGRDLASADPPIEALIVYNSNPVAVAPESRSVAAGFAREDLFTVVLEQFQTDTADYADYVLPATTQLEHADVHKSYGHLYMLANNPAIAPLGEALPNSEIFRRLAAEMGFDEPCFRESDDEIAAAAFTEPSFDWQALKRKRLATARPPADLRAVRERRLPDEERQVRDLLGARSRSSASIRCRATSPPHEVADTALAARFPLAMISPPARNFLNSTFVNVQSLRDAEGEPHLEIHPHDAAARGIADGARVRVFNDRGSLAAQGARHGPRAARRRRRAVGLVEEARARRQERQRAHEPGADRHRPRADVLRLPRRDRARDAVTHSTSRRPLRGTASRSSPSIAQSTLRTARRCRRRSAGRGCCRTRLPSCLDPSSDSDRAPCARP